MQNVVEITVGGRCADFACMFLRSFLPNLLDEKSASLGLHIGEVHVKNVTFYQRHFGTYEIIFP